MHLIFERYKGRFRSNCNILALAWTPYYQESKFRQALYDYHQKQLINVTRSTLNASNQLQRLDSPANARELNHNDINIVPPVVPSHSVGGNHASGADYSRANDAAANEVKVVLPNARLLEQHQRHVLSISEPSKANIEQNLKKASNAVPNYTAANEALDSRYGRMSDFGWLAIGNIGKIVGVSLTSTVSPPNEIDGRKLSSQDADDLILLDDSEPVQSGAQSNKNPIESSPYERSRPDRKSARGNYNLRGHLDEIILVKWNELYQKLATVDSKGNVLIWCKVNEKFTIQTPFYNRSKSVADFKWSNDGKTALICFTDSFILVGSSTSQRHWHSMLNLDDYHITCASWAPNDEQLLLGVSNGNVVIIDLPHSQLTELVVGVTHIRAMCWSSCDMNLRHLSKRNGQDQESTWADTSAFTSPSKPSNNQNSAIVNQRRLSRDCSVFSRYRFCSQAPVNGNSTRDNVPNACGGFCRASSSKGFGESHRNILAMDFANNTIKLFDAGLNDSKPYKIEVNLESYLMAWSSDGKVLAVAGFNISTSAAPPRCLRCKYLNHVKFYNQQGGLILDMKLNFTRYPITALTWAHEDQRLFLATGPRLHCARVYFGVPKLSLLAMSCVHRNTKYPNKVELLDSLFRQQKQRSQLQQHEHHYKNTSLLNWQSFNCPLELEDVLASSEKPLSSATTLASTSNNSISFTPSSVGDGNEQAVLKYNFNISNYQLPAKLKMSVDQLFLQTLRQPFDEQLTLGDVVWHVPKNQQRCYCTLICYTHELVDIACGASVGHQYKTHEINEREASSSGNQQSSDHFKIFVLYVENEGSLIPILKARRVGVLKPEFVIFDPEDVSSRNYHRRQKVSDITNLAKLDPYNGLGQSSVFFDRQQPSRLSSHNCSSLHESPLVLNSSGQLKSAINSGALQSLSSPMSQLGMRGPLEGQNQFRMNIGPASSTSGMTAIPSHSLLSDPSLIHLMNQSRNQSHRKSSKDGARSKQRSVSRQEEARRMAIERYRAFASRNMPEAASTSKNLKTLPEKSELVRIRSNIWGTRFKVINIGNRMIAHRAHLSSVTYKASILHLQPRQIFLSMKDMTNYCILCSMHHHTKARNDCPKLQGQNTTEMKSNPETRSEINLIDLPIVNNPTDFATPLRWPSGGKRNGKKKELSRTSRERRDEDKVVLPVGDNIRVAPKLELHQRYKLSSRSNSSSRNSGHKTPNKSSKKTSNQHGTPLKFHKQRAEPVAGISRSTESDTEFCKTESNYDDILTLSLDEGNQVQLGMVLNEDRVSPKTSHANKQLNEFLKENKTLKSIQTITKMIVDLSSRAHDDEAGTGASINNEATSSQPEDSQTSPIKILKLSDQDSGQEIRSPSRYVPPETPVHRPRRVAANMMRPHVSNWKTSIKAQSVSSTPTRLIRCNSSRRGEQFHINEPSSALVHEDTPLPPPPPSVPFRRKLSSSAKRFFDGSLRSLTGGSGYSTSEELDDSEDCEPLMSRRERRMVSKFNFAHNQSQPCTPMRSMARLESSRKQSIDLIHLKNQLLDRFRNSGSRNGCEHGPFDGNIGARKGTSTSHLDSTGCTKRSRWVHKDNLSTATKDSRGYSAESEFDYSSSSSSTSLSSSSISDLSGVDGSEANVKKRELNFMRHVNSVRNLGKKSAKSLTDLARINSGESRASTSGAVDLRCQSNEQTHKRRRRRHNRKSICPNANCCCAREFKLNNRPPVWNELSEVYQLDFGGRVTQESAKNLQIDFNGNLALQFGRIDKCTYTLDYKYPFNAVQAMSIALASLTQRLK